MAALRKRLTAEEAAEGEFGPDNNTISRVGFFGILRASGGEAAGKGIAKNGVAQGVVIRRDIFLVEGEHKYFRFYIVYFTFLLEGETAEHFHMSSSRRRGSI